MCGCALGPIYYVCRRCWERLAKQRDPRRRQVDDLEVRSLWTWHRRDDALGVFLKKRKLIDDPRGEERLAAWMLAQVQSERPFDVIAFPCKRESRADHGWRLAQAVSQWSGAPICAVVLEDISDYKHLSRISRKHSRAVEDVFCPTNIARLVLLVNDVVTTGATLNSLWPSGLRPILSPSAWHKVFQSGDQQL